MDERQKIAAEHLALGVPRSEVAAGLGIDRTTLWRWTCRPDFRAELERLAAVRRQRFERALNEAVEEAADSVAETLIGPTCGSRTRLLRELLRALRPV